MQASRFLLLAAILWSACAISRPPKDIDVELEQLHSYMSGSFSSMAQANFDSSYYDISLHMCPIWPERSQGAERWLYVEQAMSARPEKPYRQRVYRLSRVDANTISSEAFTLADPAAYIGAWEQPQRFGQIGPDSLDLRDGCTVFLNRQRDGSWRGSTQGRTCASDINGAAYATSEVSIFPNTIVSWDRGFDRQGKQVWGATRAGYIFKKTRSLAPPSAPAAKTAE